MISGPIIKITPILNSTEGSSLCSSLKRIQLFEAHNSINLFYSEIEHCWLIVHNTGSITINGKRMLNKYLVLEEYVQVGVGQTLFNLHNLSNSCSFSKILANSLIKSKNLTMKLKNIITMIREYLPDHKDDMHVIDIISENPIFTYKSQELTLNAEELYSHILDNKSCFLNGLIYEYEHDFLKKSRFFSINARIISDDPLFRASIQDRNQITKFNWPAIELLEKFSNFIESTSSEEMNKMFSNRRYINPYIVPDYNEKLRINSFTSSSDEMNHKSLDNIDRETKMKEINQKKKIDEKSNDDSSIYNRFYCNRKTKDSDLDAIVHNYYKDYNAVNGINSRESYINNYRSICNYNLKTCDSQKFNSSSQIQNEKDYKFLVSNNNRFINKYAYNLNKNNESTYSEENQSDSCFTQSTIHLSNPEHEDEILSNHSFSTLDSSSEFSEKTPASMRRSTILSQEKDYKDIYLGMNKNSNLRVNIDKNEYRSAISKRKKTQLESTDCICKYDFEFPTVVEEVQFNSDSETSIASFRSERMGLKPRKTQEKQRKLSFVEHQLINRRKCYENYFPFGGFEQSLESDSNEYRR